MVDDARITRTSGLTMWRAGCGGSRTSGLEGGPEKPTDSRDGRALRSDPYTEHPTREGKVYCAVVLDVFSRRVVGWSIDSRPQASLATNALAMAIENREPHGSTIHSDHGTLVSSPLGRSLSAPEMLGWRCRWDRSGTAC